MSYYNQNQENNSSNNNINNNINEKTKKILSRLAQKSKETIDLNDIEIDIAGELKQPESENNKDNSVKYGLIKEINTKYLKIYITNVILKIWI